MPLIKRYPNRKLYDTENNRYINLNTIARMIKEGYDVKVIDHVTGDDITSVTFAQIIMEHEKKERAFVPQTILAELIRVGGESISSIRKNISAHGDFFHQVDQEISIRLEKLIQLGEIAEEEAKKIRDQLIVNGKGWDRFIQYTDEEIIAALIRHGVPSRKDYEKILDKFEELSSRVEAK